MLAITTGRHALEHLQRAELRGLFEQAAQVFVPLAIAVWTYRAGSHLRRIVRTEGSDIEHLMRAIAALSKLYILQLLLLLILVAALASLWMGGSLMHWVSPS
jgi:hypothetical protein